MVDGVVYIVDDDAKLREAAQTLLISEGLETQAFASAEDFLSVERRALPECLVLDLRLDGMSGLELQQALLDARQSVPIIFLTGHGDVRTAVQAVKDGAFDFIEKPFKSDELIALVRRALARNAKEQKLRATVDNLSSLTARELEVFEMLVMGKTNKCIAYDFGLSISTVEFHRKNIMTKLQARSLEDLIQIHSANASLSRV